MLRDLGKLAFIHVSRNLSDETAIAIDYARAFGQFPNLANPTRFSEKMQAYKLCGRDNRMPGLVDKIAVKRHVAQALGPEWVTPTLWSGRQVSEHVLRSAGAPVVLKANHVSGKIIFVDANTDLRAAARRANAWRRYDYHLLHREWPYGEVRRRLLIEPRIAEPNQLADYKFWVFDGDVALVQVDQHRFARHTRDFFDASWVRLDLRLHYPQAAEAPPRPRSFEAMLEAARTLGAGFNFVRVDLYDHGGAPRFGELTFWPEAGLCRFDPPLFDRVLGDRLPYPVRTIPVRPEVAEPAAAIAARAPSGVGS